MALTLILTACNQNGSTYQSNKTDYDKYLDSLKNVKFDTTTLNGKYEKIVADLKIDNSITLGGVDTLIDLNYDGQPDILVEYYGTAGSGMKNYIFAYLYNKEKSTFVIDTFLSGLISPTFNFKKKTITSFYIANGGGDAWKYYWDGKVSKPLENYHFEINDTKSKLQVKCLYKNLVSGEKFESVDTIVSLPIEYNYCNYSGLIKLRGVY